MLIWIVFELRGQKKTTETVEEREQTLSLSGATTLADIRSLLKEWFSSTDSPEDEDRDEVSKYLVSLVANRNLDSVEPIVLFMIR